MRRVSKRANRLKKSQEELRKKMDELEKKIQEIQIKMDYLERKDKLKPENKIETHQLLLEIKEEKKDKINIQENNEKTNNNQIINTDTVKKEEELNNITNNDLKNNINNSDIITRINYKIKENKEIIYKIQDLKNGAICFASNNAAYIIKDNSEIITLFGFRKVILQSRNGNLLTSRFMNILIYSNNKFLNYEKININCYPRQIIEIEEENKFLILSKDSELKILQGETIVDNINNYRNENKISSIKKINSKEIVILLENKTYKNNENKILIFYDLKSKNEIKRLKLESKPIINNDDILCIHNYNLYASLYEALFKIDIIKKIILMKTNFGFSKFYRFENNFFGIKMNKIYNIIEGDKIIEEKIIYEDSSPNIYCIYPIKEKKMIFSTEKRIKYYNLE